MASGGTLIRTQSFRAPDDAPQYLKNMLNDIGLQEWVHNSKGQKVSNPTVQGFVASAMHLDEWKGSTLTTAWCAYYLNARLERCGIPGTKSGMARSFKQWGERIWDKGKGAWPSDKVKIGDIIGMWRGSHDDGVTGHIFAYLFEDKMYVYGVGGNQGDAVTIQKFPKHKMLFIRRPRPITESKTVQGGGAIVGNETVVKPAIDTIPDSSLNPSGGLEGMIDALRGAQGPIETLAAVKPALQLLASAITIGIAIYIIYWRYKAWKGT